MATSASVEVSADHDTMWSIISDLEASANAISAVKNFAYLDRDSKSRFEVGTRVRETRAYKNTGETTIIRQVISISDDEETPRSVSFTTKLEEPLRFDFSNTSTLTVVPLTDTTCELVGSYAVKTSGNIFNLNLLAMNCYFCWERKCDGDKKDKRFIAELEDLAAAAQKKMANAKETAKQAWLKWESADVFDARKATLVNNHCQIIDQSIENKGGEESEQET